MSEYLDVMSTETDRIAEASRELVGLARAFYRTGNGQVADDLMIICENLSNSEAAIRKAYREEIHDQHQTALSQSGNMIKACLTAISEAPND